MSFYYDDLNLSCFVTCSIYIWMIQIININSISIMKIIDINIMLDNL